MQLPPPAFPAGAWRMGAPDGLCFQYKGNDRAMSHIFLLNNPHFQKEFQKMMARRRTVFLLSLHFAPFLSKLFGEKTTENHCVRPPFPVKRSKIAQDTVSVLYTKNGLATNTGRGGTINLKDDCYGKFGKFIATSLKGIEEHDGIHFNYISPINEADGHWNWTGPKQEGTPATNREFAKVTREVSKALLKNKLNTEILINESSDYRCMLGTHMADWQRGYEINSFFTKDSTQTYVGNVKQLLPLIGAHSYWTNTPIPYMREIRMKIREACKQKNIKFWQTELCIMGNDEEIGGGTPYDFSMKTALYVARVIHHDLVYANAESWSWWRSAGGDYRDGLIRIYSKDGWKSGWAVDSKLMWALGNYSRFIRPGAQRYDIATTSADGKQIEEGYNDPYGVMCSAYQNADGKWVIVAINYSEDVKHVNFQLDNQEQKSWQMYRTSDISAESLAPVGICDGTTQLAPRSITTFMQK